MRSGLTRLRDRAYDVIASEGDFALQFVADVIRGPDATRGADFIGRDEARRAGSEGVRLTFEERCALQELMRRQPGETIIEHWKRQKRLLAQDDKKDLAQQYLALQAAQSKVDRQKQSAAGEKEKRKLAAQFAQIRQARYVPRQRQ